MLFPLRLSGVAVATLVSPVGNCNRLSTASPAGVRDSTVMTGKRALACAFAAENAATVRTAPARAGRNVRSRVEMWRMPILNSTRRRTLLAQHYEFLSGAEDCLARKWALCLRFNPDRIEKFIANGETA
jgi:hypothetical protein